MDDTTKAMIGTIVRTLITTFGGGAIFSPDQLTALSGAVAVLVAVGWGLLQKSRAGEKKQEAVSVAANMVANGADPDHVVRLSKAGIL